MSVDGYGKNIPEQVFLKLGRLCEFDDTGVRQIFTDTFEALSEWQLIAKQLGINCAHTKEIQQRFNDLFKQYSLMSC